MTFDASGITGPTQRSVTVRVSNDDDSVTGEVVIMVKNVAPSAVGTQIDG